MVQTGRPSADNTDGDWTDKSGGSTLYTSIDDTGSGDDDTTYIKVTDDGSEHACIVEIGNLSSPDSGDRTITYKALAEDGSFGGDYPNLKIEILEGGSVLDPAVTITNNSVATDNFTSVTTSTLNVSGVSDWTDLQFRLTMLPGSGSMMGESDLLKVTQIYLTIPDAGGASVPIAAIAMNTYRQMRN
jgi:hypothetical protein